jgi:hypothetical protein
MDPAVDRAPAGLIAWPVAAATGHAVASPAAAAASPSRLSGPAARSGSPSRNLPVYAAGSLAVLAAGLLTAIASRRMRPGRRPA